MFPQSFPADLPRTYHGLENLTVLYLGRAVSIATGGYLRGKRGEGDGIEKFVGYSAGMIGFDW